MKNSNTKSSENVIDLNFDYSLFFSLIVKFDLRIYKVEKKITKGYDRYSSLKKGASTSDGKPQLEAVLKAYADSFSS